MAMTGLSAIQGLLPDDGVRRRLGGDPSTAASILDMEVLVPPMVALMIVFLGGAGVGLILLAAVVWRCSRFPRIAALGVIAFAVLDLTSPFAVVSHVLWLVTNGILAWAVVSGYARRKASA